MDTTIACRLCGEDFVFGAGEQELQRIRGIDRQPTRCSACLRRPATIAWMPTLAAVVART